MKKLILLALCLYCFDAFCQNGDSKTFIIDSLQQRIHLLEDRLAEKHYTRVPSSDLENLLNTKISSEVYNSIYKWIAFLGALIGLVGVFIGAYNKTQIREQVEKEINKGYEQLKTELQRLSVEQDKKNSDQDKKMDSLQKDFTTYLDTQQTMKADISRTIDERINTLVGFIWSNVADSLIKKAEEHKFNSFDTILEIEQFLDRKNIPLPKEKLVTLVDVLMRCYYYYIGKAINDRYIKMIDLLKRFENEYELKPETYANAAIALCNKYELYGVKSDRDTCLEACDKSISRLQDYGLAYAIKLEVYAIDYFKAYDETEKQSAIEHCKRTFKAIANNSSIYICKELIDRLEGDKLVGYLQPYILKIEELFVEEMAEIRNRVVLSK